MDLSLAFLWWTNVQTRGAETVRGRDCYVLDATPPGPSFEGIRGARLWIDPQISLVLRAEFFNADTTAVRRVDIKGFKKINGRWFIKDIEVAGLATRTKTILRVREVEDRARKQFIRVDEGGSPGSPGSPAPGEMEDVEPVAPPAP
jgi:hypothetical protein